MWSRKQIGWISTSWLIRKSGQLSLSRVYNDSLHILYRSVSPHMNWGKSGFKNASFGISLIQQTSECLLCWVDTKWLSQKLLLSESQSLTGEADSPANYKHGRMCLRAVGEAWTTYYRITEGGAHSPAWGGMEGLRERGWWTGSWSVRLRMETLLGAKTQASAGCSWESRVVRLRLMSSMKPTLGRKQIYQFITLDLEMRKMA